MCVCVCLLAQSCPTLCDLMDYSPPISSVHGIFPARILKWLAISPHPPQKRSSQPRDLPNPGIKLVSPTSPALADRFIVTDPLGKPMPANAGDKVLIPELGQSAGEGNGNPLQYSCLGNAMDRGAWQAIYSPWSCKRVGNNLATKQQQCVYIIYKYNGMLAIKNNKILPFLTIQMDLKGIMLSERS